MDDLVSKEQAIDKIKKRLFETAFNNVGIKQNIDETLVDVAENRLENWFDELLPIQPDIIRCKDCKHRDENGCCKHWKGLSISVIPIATDDDDFCSYAKRRTDE